MLGSEKYDICLDRWVKWKKEQQQQQKIVGKLQSWQIVSTKVQDKYILKLFKYFSTFHKNECNFNRFFTYYVIVEMFSVQ